MPERLALAVLLVLSVLLEVRALQVRQELRATRDRLALLAPKALQDPPDRRETPASLDSLALLGP